MVFWACNVQYIVLFCFLWGSILVFVYIISPSLFRAQILHWFPIDLRTDFDLTLNVFVIPFPFEHATCNTFKNDDPHNEFACFYSSKLDFLWFPWSFSLSALALIFDRFWYQVLLHLWKMKLLIIFLIKYSWIWSEVAPKLLLPPSRFGSFSRPLFNIDLLLYVGRSLANFCTLLAMFW